VRSLGKLYDPKSIRFRQTLSDNFTVRIDEADLLEVLGNVLENACRYGASQIVIHDDPVKRQIIFDDNGPGFTQSGEAISHDPNVLLQRGVRADTSAEGSGMGLAASEQIMRNYGGKLNLSHSPEGGARVVVQFA